MAEGLRSNNKSLPKSKITLKQFDLMNRTANGVKGVLDNLRNQLKVLEEEIKADEDGKAEFERQLANLQRRKEDLLKRIKENREWASTYDSDMGPFQSNYDNIAHDIGDLYSGAKKHHKQAIGVLKREFGYHPEFKRPTDTFSASPFRPK
uniref:Uncharacterized protein n=1 Tax=Fibrocapsa japonica TaxID=94617 RepID=A0A7S2V5K3_9STRA|mmetsp:Transcript_3731/g.5530  ORF Transcript_3731/g.5530 Transcript_3731/m.5530 type:complete len:150 (+) Transcript_3731:101-550(+)